MEAIHLYLMLAFAAYLLSSHRKAALHFRYFKLTKRDYRPSLTHYLQAWLWGPLAAQSLSLPFFRADLAAENEEARWVREQIYWWIAVSQLVFVLLALLILYGR